MTLLDKTEQQNYKQPKNVKSGNKYVSERKEIFNSQLTMITKHGNFYPYILKFLYLFIYIQKVPKPFVGKRNQHDRLVLLSYTHESKKPVGLWKTGPGKPDP